MKARRFRRDDRGNMAVLFAMGFAVSAVVSAVAVDAAALYHQRRGMQAGVDLAAIAAAAAPADAEAIARSVLAEAGLLGSGDDGLSVVVGRYRADPGLRPEDRFTPGAEPGNAVRVALQRPGTLHFARGWTAAPTIGAVGLATVTPDVSFSVGSRLASLNGGLANAVLGALLGTELSLSVMDYTALVSARVDALAFLDALALELGVTAGSYDELLAMEAGAGAIAGALADLVDGTGRAALHALALRGRGSPVPVGDLIDLGRFGRLDVGSAGDTPFAALSVLELLSATAALADGARQASLNLGAAVPGLAGLRLDLAVGEPPQGGGWFKVGPAGTVVRTAQLRLRLVAQLLGGPVLLGAGVRLPLWLDLAHAEARVAAAACPSAAEPRGSASIDVRPGALRLAVGEMSDAALARFGTAPSVIPARLIDVLLLRVTGSAYAELAQTAPVRLDFSSADIASGATRTARTRTPVASLAGSLLGTLDLEVNVLGLGLASPAIIAQAVRSLVMPLAPTLDLTLDAVLSALGLGLGEADVRVYGVRCTNAVLVG